MNTSVALPNSCIQGKQLNPGTTHSPARKLTDWGKTLFSVPVERFSSVALLTLMCDVPILRRLLHFNLRPS